jgi:McbB family protein
MGFYFVKPFHLQKLGETSVVLTSQKIVKLVNQSTSKFLEKLSIHCEQSISKEHIEVLCNELNIEYCQIVDYLEKNISVLRPLAGKESDKFSTVNIFADKFFHLHMNDLTQRLNAIGINDIYTNNLQVTLSNFRADPNTLAVIMLAEYSKNIIANIYRELRKVDGISLVTAYFSGQKFYVDSPYIPESGTPCHFCHAQWELRISKQGKKHNSMFHLLKQFENHGLDRVPIGSVYLSQMPIALSFLASRLSLYLDTGTPQKLVHFENLLNRCSLNLTEFTVAEAVASHWPGCSCQHAYDD